MIDKSFMERAACRGLDPDLFHPEGHDNDTAAAAKAVCWTKCTVREECLEYALVNREPLGIWGGETETARKRLLTRRRSAGELLVECAGVDCSSRFAQRRGTDLYCSDPCRRAARTASQRRSSQRASRTTAA